MPRTNTRTNWALILGTAARVCLALAALWLVARIEAWSIKQENTISVPAEPRGPALEQALKSLSDAWREENRNR